MGNKSFVKAFGENLRFLRESRGLTIEELAFKSGIDESQLGRVERGAINTSLEIVHRISKGLKIPVKDLFDFTSE
ncbi:helix-turn-helix domain-containing protein [Sinomicrobium weinanense]|uniref:Helix-turn-helix transcriptional regulator n=1 Tax=Sinomicrobium weinanense TaxID=2842200 RepID=A0A926JR31_9FLAO|nr:helix-turn-helix transcriptional regulator [Sinomicrobium weinanense]MBU3125295.1 helix-turn-helix domain-containing protein [Sinomicrobium weinanense]